MQNNFPKDSIVGNIRFSGLDKQALPAISKNLKMLLIFDILSFSDNDVKV